MNKYYQILKKVLADGKTQKGRKGESRYLLNETVTLSPAELLDIFEGHNIARKKLRSDETGYVDFITLSSSLMFSMKYKLSVPEMRKEALYNNIRKADYPECTDYLEGLEIVSCDYKELFNRYKDTPGVVFLVDPPYLSTDVGTYNMSWRMSDYLDVLNVLSGHPFVYFTSNKSSILELCEWIGKNKNTGNPFEGCTRMEFNAHINYSSSYTDMMLFKKEAA